MEIIGWSNDGCQSLRECPQQTEVLLFSKNHSFLLDFCGLLCGKQF